MTALLWIVGYLAVGWVVALILGITDETNSCQWDLTLVAGLFWPFFLAVSAFCTLCEWIGDLKERFSSVGKVLNYLSLPFRPYTLGRMICEWFRNRKESEDDDD